MSIAEFLFGIEIQAVQSVVVPHIEAFFGQLGK